jgi:hypothetical protein
MQATASAPENRNAWTRRFVTEMEKLAAPLFTAIGQWRARAESLLKLRNDRQMAHSSRRGLIDVL